MRRKRFLVFNALAALWVLVWTGVGYFSGSHIDAIYRNATRYDAYLGIAVVVLVIAYVSRRVVRARRSGAGEPGGHPGPEPASAPRANQGSD
jgi:membrane protein DedA with SNARE-associated domain